MQLKKALLALALTSTLAACGSDRPTPTPPPPPPPPPAPVETVISGKALKGVLTNAVVTVYKFIGGFAVALTATELSDANISTDSEGNYSLTVLDYDGPIKIELSPSTDPANPTTMTCDAPAGCGSIAYGAEINLTTADPSFKLVAISSVNSESNGNVKTNVSALTHIASKLIEADSAGITIESITENSSKIAATFGILGDITLLEPTVTDSPAAMAGEDNAAELRYGLINAGIMAALFSGEISDAEVLSRKLAEVAADLIENNGAILVNQDDDDGFELALAEVLAGAAAAAQTAEDAIAADETLTSIQDLAQQQVNLANEQIAQEANVGDDGRAVIIVDTPTEGDAVAKAKAMVNDVRLFTHLFDEETDHNSGITSQGDEYIALVDDASQMIETEANSFELLAKVSDALTTLSMAYDDGTITEAMAAAGINITPYIDTVTGTVTFEEETATGGVLFQVDVTSGNEIVKLKAMTELSEDKQSIKLSLYGSLESAGAMFTLNEGSFAQINLDSSASREAFENDTYEGDIVSGELNLSLTIAQKQTETETNPVSFTGQLNTKLSLVNERVLDERWDWDNENQQNHITYGRPELESSILPEMLSLSGSFSSLEGDLLSASLTVNIKNLDSYQAPEFEYIGKEVADISPMTFSDDLNTIVITQADIVSDKQQTVETRIYTPGSQMGEWTATSSVVATNAEEHYWGTGIERKIITTRFDSGLDEQGILYTRAYITGETENNFGIKSIRITPVDHDENGSTDAYHFEAIGTWDDKSYDATSFATLMDANGNILTSDGEQHSWDTSWDIGEFTTIDQFIMYNPYQLIANPLSVDNGAKLLAQTITNWWGNQRSLDVDELGTVTLFFNEEEIETIASSELTELNPMAYLTQPLLKDALSVAVSEDANTVSYTIENGISREFTFVGAGSGNFTATEVQTSFNEWDSEIMIKNIVSSSINEGLDADEVMLNISTSHMSSDNEYMWQQAHQILISPQDNDKDGVTDEFIAMHAYGHHFNAEGQLVNEDNSIVSAFYHYAQFDSYDAVHWDEPNFVNDIPFNPLTVTNALDVFKNVIANEAYSPYIYVNGIGKLEVELTDEDLESIVANSTTMFDAINTQADSRTSFENEDTFLDLHAALTLEAILGDYQVKLQLSGQRTHLEDGKFDLAMSYRLPDDEAQRSFTIHANTEREGRLTANNFEGVVLVLDEPEGETEGTQVLGQILVGPTAIVAAIIEDRDGLVVIVYSDETIESL